MDSLRLDELVLIGNEIVRDNGNWRVDLLSFLLVNRHIHASIRELYQSLRFRSISNRSCKEIWKLFEMNPERIASLVKIVHFSFRPDKVIDPIPKSWLSTLQIYDLSLFERERALKWMDRLEQLHWSDPSPLFYSSINGNSSISSLSLHFGGDSCHSSFIPSLPNLVELHLSFGCAIDVPSSIFHFNPSIQEVSLKCLWKANGNGKKRTIYLADHSLLELKKLTVQSSTWNIFPFLKRDEKGNPIRNITHLTLDSLIDEETRALLPESITHLSYTK
eukprot:TRINITY_DN12146_c0_g1_i1.p1 TRINITY_DN12146_c0_g1~~TRINITY_DN12146_c0_g1_i1.p1  ORF type:complete len:276 (+),score=61.29 TRINITY_DN12146_c0_g1_i1:2-829(+)